MADQQLSRRLDTPDPGTPGTTVPSEAGRPSRRAAMMTACLTAAGAGLAVAASGRDWAHGRTMASLSLVPISASGKTLTAVPYGLALVALAGAVVLLTTRRLGRLLTACVVMLSGAGVVAATISELGGLRSGLATTVAVRLVGHGDPVVSHVSATIWPYVTIAGGLAVVLGGAVAAVRGYHWPGMSSRYDAPAAQRARTSAARPGGPRQGEAVRELWDALERGEDPTAS